MTESLLRELERYFKNHLAINSPALLELVNRLRTNNYLRGSWYANWHKQATQDAAIPSLWQKLKWLLFNRDRLHSHQTLIRILVLGEQFRTVANHQIRLAVIQENDAWLDAVEKNPLTTMQRDAVASDEDCTLVLAGAGTGKTSTLVAKIGLLVKTGQCQADEILAISYTNKSATELEERVKDRLGLSVAVSTFHKLGLSIVSKTYKAKPSLAPFVTVPKAKAKHIEALINELVVSSINFRIEFLRFLAYFRVINKSCWEFEDLASYKAWLDRNNMVSLNGERMMSLEECHIANWLLLQGIDYVYEQPYEVDTRTPDRRQYKPDFYLPKIKAYLEHFGVDKQGLPAPFIDATEYRRGMDWKRKTHQENNTRLLETFSWEFHEGNLFSNLGRKLKELGAQFSPIAEDQALTIINKAGVVSNIATLLGTFLTLYKGNPSSQVQLFQDTKPGSNYLTEREKSFLALFKQVFDKYEACNQSKGEIDFEDMIGQSLKCVESSAFTSPYRYILIDEFQDISPGRAALIKALQKSSPNCALFAVGDDWQAIYRFAGSDIGVMTGFEELFGFTYTVALDKTFRFDDKSAKLSSLFILKNEAQIPKTISANRLESHPSTVLFYRTKEEPFLEWSLDEIVAEAQKRKLSNPSVLVLERYSFHLPKDSDWVEVRRKYRCLELHKMTIHAAKGLEADFVIVGLRGGEWSFPSEVEDDPLLGLVLSEGDNFPYGEERRLFYVALTRARYKTYLVSEAGADKSVFTRELEEGVEYDVEIRGEDEKSLRCPKCKSGMMLLRSGIYGGFYRCSLFPLCTHSEKACPECGKGYMVKVDTGDFTCNQCEHHAAGCPRCGTGYLLVKNGPRGQFMGCSNYSDSTIHCNYSEPI